MVPQPVGGAPMVRESVGGASMVRESVGGASMVQRPVATASSVARGNRRQPGAVVHTPPVDAPVVDPFRPPPGPFGAGNRGLEYGTAPGSPVRASASGTVTFAGTVAGALHVTVLHDDGVRTSYSFLAGIDVVAGQPVGQGDRVGTSGERLHFGARIGDAYFDPAMLFAGAVADVELLPLDDTSAAASGDEAGALAALTAGVAGGVGLPGMGGRLPLPGAGRGIAVPGIGDGNTPPGAGGRVAGPGTGGGIALPGVDDALAWLRARARAGPTYAGQVDPLGRGVELARDLVDRVVAPGPCSAELAPERPVAGQRRVAVTVAGLGSTSGSASIDDLRVGDLGYATDRVVRFSYAGGRTPATGTAFPTIDARPYGSADTQGDVAVAAARLADLVEQVARADPEAVVDVVAHSLGGLVARLALVDLERRGFDLGRLGVVVTLGSPHRGADAASVVAAANARLPGHLALGSAESVLGTGLDPDATVATQLAEHSPAIGALADAGVPAGVRLVSIAARGDVVVAAPRTRVAGAVNVTVPVGGPGAHADLVGSDQATAEVARALAGQPPGCESWGDALADVATGHAVSLVEDQAGALVARGW
ncbi:MAG TPA: peptidoglycan DD-metalloendopeptidase family protein [Acidimicrobiales bacterium]|nr:peptidoglycan DD-metalloendopeptidase family protein [Acidimicrobiales bacterium]